MNLLKACALGVLLSLGCMHASAQRHVKDAPPLNEPDYNKPRIFTDLPRSMRFEPLELEDLLDLAPGAPVATRLTDHFTLRGTVVSRAGDEDVKSVVVKSSTRQGATFTFTRTRRPDGTFAYLGRMLSLRHGDALELVYQDGHYQLEKRELHDLVSE